MFFPSSAPGACGRCSCCTLLLLQHGDGRAREGSLLVEEDTHAARNATLPSLHWPTSRAPRPCWAFLAPTCQEEGRVSCTQPMSRRGRQAGGPLSAREAAALLLPGRRQYGPGLRGRGTGGAKARRLVSLPNQNRLPPLLLCAPPPCRLPLFFFHLPTPPPSSPAAAPLSLSALRSVDKIAPLDRGEVE